MEPGPILLTTRASSPPSESPNSKSPNAEPTLLRGLGLLDSVLLLVSGIIGSSIFLTAKDIAGPLPQPVLFLLVWVLGALISLCACFAFAELGSMFPDSGGQYIYLREAYGDLIAFLYGWMLFSVANGGSIAALAVASAAYVGQVLPVVSQDHVVVAFAGVVITRAHLFGLFLIAVLTYVNVVGLRWGALLQNISTWTKFTAMSAFVVLGFAIGKGHWSNFRARGVGLTMGLGPAQLISALGVGMIAVFWAYDGWVYITWVAGEVKEPRRNVPLAMVLGVLPLITASGAGAVSRFDMGLVIATGLAIGTLFTLFVVPAVYLLMAADHHTVPAEQPNPATAAG